MRWLLSFVLLLLAVGTLRTVGCGDESPCGDCSDGNPCTRDYCDSYRTGGSMCDPGELAYRCEHDRVANGTDCSVEGQSGACVNGWCDLCAFVECPPDDNECTTEHCSRGECLSSPVVNGTPCTFKGLFAGVCVSGFCGKDLCEDVVCDDGDACTVGTCDYVDGTCDFVPTVCEDQEECTEDTCDSVDGCVFTPVEDGTRCGFGDWVCIAGDCVPPECESSEDCDDRNPCTEETCGPVSACIFTPVEDGTACEGRFGMCDAGSCVPPCDLEAGEVYLCPIIGLEDLFCCPGSENCRGSCAVPECQTPEDCNDENPCTRDRCDYVNGNCDFPPVVCNDNNPCTEDTCDPAHGCVFTTVDDGTECWGGVCIGGVCVDCDGSEDCDDGNECTEGVCAAGVCEYPPVADGTPCASGAGACEAGSCVGVTAWRMQNSGTTKTLYGVSFTDTNNGTVVGRDGTILRTTDGGETWTAQDSGTTDDFRSVSFTSADTGTVVSWGRILRTTDGGATWLAQEKPYHDVSLEAVSFADSSFGLAVGARIAGGNIWSGAILYTSDGGTTWRLEDSGTRHGLNAVSFTGRTAVGDSATILRRGFWGTWTEQDVYYGDALRGVSFTDTNNGTAVGNSGIILRTTDGGVTWRRQDASGPGASLYGVSFTDANNGTIVGARGTIMKTKDGGATWVEQDSGTSSHLWGVSFVDANTGTAVGENGIILRTTGEGAD